MVDDVKRDVVIAAMRDGNWSKPGSIAQRAYLDTDEVLAVLRDLADRDRVTCSPEGFWRWKEGPAAIASILIVHMPQEAARDRIEVMERLQSIEGDPEPRAQVVIGLWPDGFTVAADYPMRRTLIQRNHAMEVYTVGLDRTQSGLTEREAVKMLIAASPEDSRFPEIDVDDLIESGYLRQHEVGQSGEYVLGLTDRGFTFIKWAMGLTE